MQECAEDQEGGPKRPEGGRGISRDLALKAVRRLKRRHVSCRTASVPWKECRQKPSAAKSSLNSLMRFPLSTRPL
jgi:hypothetical protein